MTKRSEKRLPRPLYEALPWLYVLLGLIALVASYLVQSLAVLSALLGLAGFAVLLGGVVVLLRRRDFRELRSQYGDPAGLGDAPSRERNAPSDSRG